MPERPSTSARLPAGEGRHVWFCGNLMTIKAGAGPDGPLTFVDARMRAGHAPPLHLHRNEEEAFHVLEGSIRFRCGDEEVVAGPGDFVLVPRGTPHAFRVGDSGARALMIATSGCLAAFMEEVGEPAREPVLPPDAGPDPRGLGEVAGRYDMTVVGPPLE